MWDYAKRPFQFILLPFAVLLAVASCQRPFVDVSAPDIEILEPDVNTVFTGTDIVVRLRTTSFRPITRVFIGDSPMSARPGSDIWEAETSLSKGLNRLIIRAFAGDDPPSVDTLLAFQMSFETDRSRYRNGNPLGGHTVTKLFDDDFLIAGGAPRIDADAVGSASIIRKGSGVIEPLTRGMIYARMGHTASLLSDGRILITGGSTKGVPESIDDLVESPEIFDPVTNRFSGIPVVGAPIRRAFHTASVMSTQDGYRIDLLGGKGDIEYTPEPLYGIRRDIRSFLLKSDTLISLSPAVGPFIARVFGQTQTPLSQLGIGEAGEYLIMGVEFGSDAEPAGFIMDFRTSLGILIDPAPIPRRPRNLHAAVLIRDGLILLSGGTVIGASLPTNDQELFVREANKYYDLPQLLESPVLARFLHTATLIAPGRILLLGGFDADGSAIEISELFDYSL